MIVTVQNGNWHIKISSEATTSVIGAVEASLGEHPPPLGRRDPVLLALPSLGSLLRPADLPPLLPQVLVPTAAGLQPLEAPPGPALLRGGGLLFPAGVQAAASLGGGGLFLLLDGGAAAGVFEPRTDCETYGRLISRRRRQFLAALGRAFSLLLREPRLYGKILLHLTRILDLTAKALFIFLYTFINSSIHLNYYDNILSNNMMAIFIPYNHCTVALSDNLHEIFGCFE